MSSTDSEFWPEVRENRLSKLGGPAASGRRLPFSSTSAATGTSSKRAGFGASKNRLEDVVRTSRYSHARDRGTGRAVVATSADPRPSSSSSSRGNRCIPQCCRLLFPWCFRRADNLDGSSSESDDDDESCSSAPYRERGEPTYHGGRNSSSRATATHNQARAGGKNDLAARRSRGGAMSNLLSAWQEDRDRDRTSYAEGRHRASYDNFPRGSRHSASSHNRGFDGGGGGSGMSNLLTSPTVSRTKLSRTSLDELFLSSDDDEDGLYNRAMNGDDGINQKNGGRKPDRLGRCLFFLLVSALTVAGCAYLFYQKFLKPPPQGPVTQRLSAVRYHYLPTATNQKTVSFKAPVSMLDPKWASGLLGNELFPVPRTPEQVIIFLEVGPEETLGNALLLSSVGGTGSGTALEANPVLLPEEEIGSSGSASAPVGFAGWLPGQLLPGPPKAPAKRKPIRSLLGPLDKSVGLDEQMRNMLAQGLVDEHGVADLNFLLTANPDTDLLRLSVWDATIIELIGSESGSAEDLARATDAKDREAQRLRGVLAQELHKRPQALVATELYFRSGRNLIVTDGAVLDVSPGVVQTLVTGGVVVKPLIERLKAIANEKKWKDRSDRGMLLLAKNRFRQEAGLFGQKDPEHPDAIRVLGNAAQRFTAELKQRIDSVFGKDRVKFAVEELRDLRDTHGVPDAVLAAVQAELAKIFAPVAQQLIQHMQPVAAGGAGGGGPGAGGLLAAGLPALFTPGTAGGGPAGVAPGSGGGSGGAPPPMSMMPPFMPGGGAFGARAGAAAGAQ